MYVLRVFHKVVHALLNSGGGDTCKCQMSSHVMRHELHFYTLTNVFRRRAAENERSPAALVASFTASRQFVLPVLASFLVQ